MKNPTLHRRMLQVLLRTVVTFPFSPTHTTNFLFSVKETSKPQPDPPQDRCQYASKEGSRTPTGEASLIE
jgi:hypothetical protein